MKASKSDSVVPVASAPSKTHFRQLALQLCLELVSVARRRFVSLFFRRKTETPKLVEIPRSGVTVAERHTAADHRAGLRDLVHLHFHPYCAGLGRSEERRVGEECRSRWSADHLKK